MISFFKKKLVDNVLIFWKHCVQNEDWKRLNLEMGLDQIFHVFDKRQLIGPKSRLQR